MSFQLGSRPARHVCVPGHYESRTQRILVEAGHYEREAEQVMVEEGYWDTQWVPAVEEVRRDRYGRLYTVIVRPAVRERIWIEPTYATRWVNVWCPARYELRTVRVWVPGCCAGNQVRLSVGGIFRW